MSDEEYLTPEKMEQLMDEEASALEHAIFEEEELASLEFPNNCCPSCGEDNLVDLRRHPEACARRQAMMRRCEEAVEEYDGPQGEPSETYYVGIDPASEAGYSAGVVLRGTRAAVRVGDTEVQARSWELVGSFDLPELTPTWAIPEVIRLGQTGGVFPPFRVQAAPPVPSRGLRRLQRQLARYRYRPTWRQRRAQAIRALRTMMSRQQVLALAVVSALYTLLIVVAGLLAHAGIAWMAKMFLCWVIAFHLALALLFLATYRREGRRRD